MCQGLVLVPTALVAIAIRKPVRGGGFCWWWEQNWFFTNSGRQVLCSQQLHQRFGLQLRRWSLRSDIGGPEPRLFQLLNQVMGVLCEDDHWRLASTA